MKTPTIETTPPSLQDLLPDDLPSGELLQAIALTARLPREKSQSLPGEAYTDQAYHEFEEEFIFRKEWISLGHVSQLKKPGDFIRVDVAGEPLLVIRGKDDQIRTLSRVCRHRGMDLLPSGFGHEDEGHKRVILCPYHLWSYDLSGKLIGSPEMQKAEGFDRSEVCLHEFRTAVWEGFIFVNIDGDAPPLEETYRELNERFLSKWEMGRAQMVWTRHWDCDFNWKILVENFMEAYHHMGAHRKTLEPFLPARGCWAEPVDDAYCAMHLPLKDTLVEEIEKSGSAGTPWKTFVRLELPDFKEWWVFLGYPNFLLFVAPDRLYWYRILPTGPETSSLLTTLLVAPETLGQEDFEAIMEKEVQAAIDFHMEDMEVCTATQRGMSSVGYEPGRLSHLEEPIWQFQQYLARVIART